MKFSDLKDLTVSELTIKGNEMRQELFALRLQQASSQLEKPANLRLIRRNIAQVETRLTQVKESISK